MSSHYTDNSFILSVMSGITSRAAELQEPCWRHIILWIITLMCTDGGLKMIHNND